MDGLIFSVRGVRVRFTFGFFAVWAILIAGVSPPRAELTLLACILHEAGHIAAARLAGVRVRCLTFQAGGISLVSDPPTAYAGFFREMLILSAGCLVNLMLAFISRLRGDELFYLVNLSLGMFNLLPFSSFDGGRMLSAIAGRISPCTDIKAAQRITDIILWAGALLYLVFRLSA